MTWADLGVVWAPDGTRPDARSHAMVPTPVVMDEDRIRVFVTCLDDRGRGRPFWVDVAADDPTRVIESSKTPSMDIGAPGTFDDNGVVMTSILVQSDDVLLGYYAGFELSHTIRYRILTGLAVSRDGGQTFNRVKETPVLERSNEEMFFRCGPFVLKERNTYRMWYIAGSEWTELNGKEVPVYRLHYLESADACQWPNKGQLSLAFSDPDEHGFGRPWVIPTDSGYEMFFSIRSRSAGGYRLGYAVSEDGLEWNRSDSEMRIGNDGQDHRMYTAVVGVGTRRYCFYNGANFGLNGFMVAEYGK